MAEPHRCELPTQADHAQLYELLVAELTDFVVFLADPDGCIVSWNPGVERILGYAEAEWIGQPVRMIFTPEDRAARKPDEELAKAARDGRAPDVRWHQRRDGSRLYVEGTLVALKGDAGQLLGFSKVMRDITERKRAEDELRSARDEARGILESVTDGFVALDREWRFTYVNPAGEKLLGTRREALLGRNHWELYALGTVVEREYRRAMRDRVPVEFEVSYEPLQAWLAVKVFPTQEGGLSVYFRSITEQKRTDEELRRQWRTFDTILSNTPDLICIFSPEGRFTYANKALLAVWQRSYEDAVGKSCQELDYPPELTEKLERQVREVVATRRMLRDETPYTDPGGNTRDYEYIFAPVFGPDGNVEAVAGSTRDITERKHLEQVLRDSEERLRQVFSQAPVGVCVLRGRELVYELVNPSYQELLPDRTVLGRPIREVIPELDPKVLGILHRVLDTGEPFVANEWHIPYDRDRDGVAEDVWFNLVYHPLREPDGTVSGVVAVVVDVTAQVRARQELERVNRGLEEFAHVASHDLQEPLRTVSSYSQLLVRRLGSEATDEQREFASFIQHGVRRMEQLIRDLLAYSRTVHTVGETAAGEASLDGALRQALPRIESRAAESGAMITHDPLPVVRGDVTQLAHVFQNLLSNALKYRQPDEPPRVHISVRRQEGEWVVAVRDNGIGFAQSQAERIFGLFKRLHRDDEYPGTGLGLAICKRIIERYGGRMWAESEPGKGATFFFALPAGP